MTLTVMVQGSCRIHKPIRCVAATGRCSYFDGGSPAYLHSAREALQRLRWTFGDISLPDRIASLVFARDATPEFRKKHEHRLAGVDFLLTEISSGKDFIFDGYFLQLNRLQMLVGPLGDLGKTWWREVSHNGRASPDTVSAIVNSHLFKEGKFSKHDAEVLSGVTQETQDEAATASTLAQIKEIWAQPMGIVSHVGLPLLNGQPLKPRMAFIKRLGGAANDLAIPVFQPANVIAAFGREHALAKNGADLDHYDDDFNAIYGWYLLNRVVRPNLGTTPRMAPA